MREQEGTPQVRIGRMAEAEEFLAAAEEQHDLHGATGHANVVVTLSVMAGIAASDVICCARLGRYSTGDSHTAAATMLRRADAGSAPRLSALLGMKTRAGYGYAPASAADVRKALRAATRLVETAREVGG